MEGVDEELDFARQVAFPLNEASKQPQASWVVASVPLEQDGQHALKAGGKRVEANTLYLNA
jgi:hypothetical protein